MKNLSRASNLIQRVWSYAHVLKDDGLAFMDYTEQITYLLFLKMAWERKDKGGGSIPTRYSWDALRQITDDRKCLARYHQGLNNLSKQPGLVGLIFTKPQSKINDPAKLRLLIKMVDSENWSEMDVDVKGDVYEGLLARNAEDVRGGAGQYFTARPIIRAVVEAMRPKPFMSIADPACGTGGFLLGAFEYLNQRTTNEAEQVHLRTKAVQGIDLVPNVARLCAMNLFLHGIGLDEQHPAIVIKDSLQQSPVVQVDMVLTNPPFGKKSSFTVIGEAGNSYSDKIAYNRKDLWVTTSNKQLNFVQHVYSMLKDNGRAAMVVPDNVLFEGGAGERIRRTLLDRCDVHTLLRLPIGIWYSPGVKANVLFFDKRPSGESPATKEIWVYDLRSAQNFSIKKNPIQETHLADFLKCYCVNDFSKRRETEHFRRFTYSEITRRDKANLDLQWRNTNGQETANPAVLMRAIVKDLRDALKEFASIERNL